MYPVLRTNYNQRPPTRVPAPCTDSMPGPSVHPPGRRATVACVLLPDVRSSARPVAQPVKAKHGGDGRGRRRGGARARACGAGAAVAHLLSAPRLYTPLVMRGGRGANRKQPPSGARGTVKAALRAAGEGGGDDDVGRRGGIRIAGDTVVATTGIGMRRRESRPEARLPILRGRRQW